MYAGAIESTQELMLLLLLLLGSCNPRIRRSSDAGDGAFNGDRLPQPAR